jgi:hypothetical protein
MAQPAGVFNLSGIQKMAHGQLPCPPRLSIAQMGSPQGFSYLVNLKKHGLRSSHEKRALTASFTGRTTYIYTLVAISTD